jgi:hypothetical protein
MATAPSITFLLLHAVDVLLSLGIILILFVGAQEGTVYALNLKAER